MLVVFAGHGSQMVGIFEAKNIQDLKELITALIEGNEDIWKVELLENILYTINNNLSTTEVA